MANSEDSHQQRQPAAMADFSYRRHVEYFLDILLEQLPSSYQESDPNRVTIAYFAISALDLLNALDQASDRLLKKLTNRWFPRSVRDSMLLRPTWIVKLDRDIRVILWLNGIFRWEFGPNDFPRVFLASLFPTLGFGLIPPGFLVSMNSRSEYACYMTICLSLSSVTSGDQ